MTEEQNLFVSVLLVTYNESAYIVRSLMSLLDQDYPKEKYEIIIADGESTDNTLSLAKETILAYESEQKILPHTRIISNPKKILASGWNIGIKASTGDYVVRIDAHAIANIDFLRKSVETMMRVDADCVGGRLTTQSSSEIGETIRDVLSSPFGVGNSSFRISETEGYADTAVYGLYKKTAIEKAGFFDESLVRNQDIELHSRIKKAGGKFYFNPAIQTTYYSRDSVKKMLKQAYGNGLWNLIILRKNKAKLSVRHLVPFCFVLFLIVTSITGIFWRSAWLFEAGLLTLYFASALVFSIKKTKQIAKIIQMIYLFFALHISYGFGSLVGLFKAV